MSTASTPTAHDKRALRILIRTHWSSAGWKRQFQTDPADLAYAIKAGYMFPPEDAAAITHDAIVARVVAAARSTDARAVADAFLASLNTRRLEWRSALASYVLARQLPPHQEQLGPVPRFSCQVCGLWGRVRDRNTLNVERHKWGGVAHLDPYYAAFDLEQFVRLTVPPPSAVDRAILIQILRIAQGMPPTARVRDLEKSLTGILPSNMSEREVLLGILGISGILTSPGHPGFDATWIPPRARTEPPHPSDWPYPISWWRGGGVSRETTEMLFPALVSPMARVASEGG